MQNKASQQNRGAFLLALSEVEVCKKNISCASTSSEAHKSQDANLYESRPNDTNGNLFATFDHIRVNSCNPMFYIQVLLLLTVLPIQADASAVINLNKLGLETVGGGVVRSETMVEKVEVEHRQKGIMLGLVPVSFNVRAIADARGNVELKHPWFALLTIDKLDEVETKLKVAVDNALRASAVGKIRAEGEPTSPRLSASQAKMVANELKRVLEESLMEIELGT